MNSRIVVEFSFKSSSHFPLLLAIVRIQALGYFRLDENVKLNFHQRDDAVSNILQLLHSVSYSYTYV